MSTPPEDHGETEEGLEPEKLEELEQLEEFEHRPLFQHPQWMVGIVMIFALVAIAAGIENPVWLLIGSPFILALIILTWIRLTA